MNRYRDLEGWRGLAALAVVAYHLRQTMGFRPYAGSAFANSVFNAIPGTVDLFFLLSGLLLSVPYWKAAINQTPAVSSKAFLWRRFTRIYPLYVVVVLVCWSSKNFSLPGQWLDLLEHLTFTQILDTHRIFYTVGPAWSLSVELAFYFTLCSFGAIAHRVCGRIMTRNRRISFLALSCLGFIAVSEAWKELVFDVWHKPLDHWAFYFGYLNKLDVLALGMLLGLLIAVLDGRLLLGRVSGAFVRTAGFASYAAISTLSTVDGRTQVYWHSLAGVAVAVLLLPSIVAPAGTAVKVLAWRPLAGLGTITFSIYLWHEALLLWLVDDHVVSANHYLPGLALLLVISTVVGIASYWAIEYPSNTLRVLIDGKGRKRRYYAELPPEPQLALV